MTEPKQPMLFENLPGERLSDHDTTLTPLRLLKALGSFDLDPCGFPGHCTAKELICWPEDGLQRNWKGRVWLNPPYSQPAPWLERLAEHGNGIALVLASTDTNWFHDYATKSSGLLFIKGRPLFLREDFTEVGLMRASVFVAFGHANGSALCNSGISGWFVPIGKESLNALATRSNWPPDYQDQFWTSYPNKKGKLAAMKALEKVAKGGKTRWADLMTALERYKMSRDVQRGFIKHPATWLNQGCWTDEEGPLQRNSSAGFFEVLADMGKHG